jgi:hypothetical protein
VTPSTTNHAYWQVTECGCGQLTLRLGRIRLELTREEFAQLHGLVEDAMNRFDIADIDGLLLPGNSPTH